MTLMADIQRGIVFKNECCVTFMSVQSCVNFASRFLMGLRSGYCGGQTMMILSLSLFRNLRPMNSAIVILDHKEAIRRAKIH